MSAPTATGEPVAPPTASPGSNDPEARRNFRLGVLNGVFFHLGEGAIDPGTVIPLFVSRLTTSNALIGFASAMADLGWLAPQIFFARRAARHPRQMPLYTRAATVRAIGLALLAALAWPLRDDPRAMLVGFFLGYGAYCWAAGFGAVAFMEIVGRTVPPARLTSFWSARLLIGGTLSAGVAVGVRELLKLDDKGFVFAILFGFAAISVSIGYICFARVREPVVAARHDVPPPLALLRHGLVLLRTDLAFRRLLVARTTLNLWSAAAPFVVLFAVRDLGGGARAAGTLLIARMVGYVLGNLVWPSLARAHGNRGVLLAGAVGCGVLGLLACAIAVASPWKLGWLGAGPAVLAFEAIAFLAGAASGGLIVGYASMSIELAPLGDRQPYVSLLNTFLGPTMLLPALGGALVDAIDAPTLFGLIGVLAFLGARAAARLPGPEEMVARKRTTESPLTVEERT